MPDNGTLFSGVLIPKLLSNPFASCSLTNLDFLIPHLTHFDSIINLPLFVSKTFEFKFSVFCLFYKIQSIKNRVTIVSISSFSFILSKNDLGAKESAHPDVPLILIFVIMISFFGHTLSLCLPQTEQ